MRPPLTRLAAARSALAAVAAVALILAAAGESLAQSKGKESGGGGTPPRSGGGWSGPGIGIPIGVAVGVATGAGDVKAKKPPAPPQSRKAGPPPRRPGTPPGPPPATPARITIPPANENRFSPDELVLEVANDQSPQAIGSLVARHQLAVLESIEFTLTSTIFIRARITDGRPARTVLGGMAAEPLLRSAQPNYAYDLVQQDNASAPAQFEAQGGPPPVTPAAAAAATLALSTDPTRYAAGKMRLPEAHALARGNNVLVAVIDSRVDTAHPDIREGIAGTLDALNSQEGPHAHGTAIAGAIASRYQFMGTAPGARILAIRAFAGTVGFSFAIMKGIEYAVAQDVRIINMSFAGPADPAALTLLAMAHDKGLVLIAASGNFGPQSPPQYPAAAPNVIAVSATDASDRLYVSANRGRHVAVSAPGVEVRLPAPNGLYQTISGTSFATGYVSGVAALLLERKPGAAPDEVKRILETSAKDLGPRGKDDQFGAGRVDAYQAVFMLEPQAASPALSSK
jgi:hypothetical protein